MANSHKTKKIAAAQYAAVPNQVFLGIPWKTIRPKYDGIVEKLKKTFPISFVIVGRDQNQDAEDLLEVIKKRLQTSSYAIFDGTGGNANVSLEFGFAEANDIPRALYLSVHGAAKKATKESPIIADLAGKNTESLYKRRGTGKAPAAVLQKPSVYEALREFSQYFFRSALKRRKEETSQPLLEDCASVGR